MILPNPWQTRQPHADDATHIADLAADIKAHGLLQIPLARVVEKDTGRPVDYWAKDVPYITSGYAVDVLVVQLAFGHNRRAAWALLAEKDPERWRFMPIRLANLDDQAMALAAWGENFQRKDLSPWEEALALQRLATEFGWPQEEIAKQVSMARSTVANKLRLLRLPTEQQQQLHNGTLSERQALSLLPLYDLPPAAVARLEERRARNDYNVRALDKALEHPEKVSSSELRDAVREALDAASLPLSTDENNYSRSDFPVDRAIVGVGAPPCTECPHCLRGKRCADPDCYGRKEEAFERNELAFALAAAGLPLLSAAEAEKLKGYNSKVYFYPDAEGQAGLQHALEHQCPNLRLMYERPSTSTYRAMSVPDYPAAVYVCIVGRQSCSCKEGDKKKREEEKRAREEQLKKAAEQLREATIKELSLAIQDRDMGAWRAVLWALKTMDYSSTHGGSVKGVKTLRELGNQLARKVINRAAHWEYPGSYDIAAELLKWRNDVGWPLAAAEEPPVEASPASEGQEDLAEIESKLARLEGWLAQGLPADLPAGAIQGHLNTLDQMAGQLELSNHGEQFQNLAARIRQARGMLVDTQQVVDVAGDEQRSLQPCNINCIGFQSVGSGRYYCTLCEADTTPGLPCPDYQPEDVVAIVAGVDDEEEL
jgi:ParB/RepB/Spo0J family partition protein